MPMGPSARSLSQEGFGYGLAEVGGLAELDGARTSRASTPASKDLLAQDQESQGQWRLRPLGGLVENETRMAGLTRLVITALSPLRGLIVFVLTQGEGRKNMPFAPSTSLRAGSGLQSIAASRLLRQGARIVPRSWITAPSAS